MGPFGLKRQGGFPNAVGVWLKYLWVSLAHFLGPTRAVSKLDTLAAPYSPDLRLVSVLAMVVSPDVV